MNHNKHRKLTKLNNFQVIQSLMSPTTASLASNNEFTLKAESITIYFALNSRIDSKKTLYDFNTTDARLARNNDSNNNETDLSAW